MNNSSKQPSKQNDELLAAVFTSVATTSAKQPKMVTKSSGLKLKPMTPSLKAPPPAAVKSSPPPPPSPPSVVPKEEENPWITVVNKKKSSSVSASVTKDTKACLGKGEPNGKANKKKKNGKKANQGKQQGNNKGSIKSTKAGKGDQVKQPAISFLSIMGYDAATKQVVQKHMDTSNNNKRKTKKTKKSKSKAAPLKQEAKPCSVSVSTTKTEETEDSTTEISNHTEIIKEASVVEAKESEESLKESKPSMLLALPYNTLTGGVMSFLLPNDLLALGSTNKTARQLTQDGFLWQTIFKERFPESQLNPKAMEEWKLAYQLQLSKVVDRLRCFATKQTFLEDILGVGIDFTVNPKTKMVDYISISQDLISQTAFVKNRVRSDVFGNKFQLFLPLYFSEEHYQRALPMIRKTVVRLCPEKKGVQFKPSMILDVFPKIITTFVVLLSDEGVSASRKSFMGLIRVHRLFLALAHQYSEIKQEAVKRLRAFLAKDENRCKSACPNLGAILPLLMIVDQSEMDWRTMRQGYLGEMFDRSVLWVCKDHPHLERTKQPDGKPEALERAEERLALTRNSMTVVLRLTMFHVFFLKTCCQGSTQSRANKYDVFFGQPDPEDTEESVITNGDLAQGETSSDVDAAIGKPIDQKPASLSFETFRNQVNEIHTLTGWQSFFRFVGLRGPQSKEKMAELLRMHVHNSRRKKYHTAGMDFSRVQASGTSKILAKGQKYSASSSLRNLVFRDSWGFEGGVKYLDATCIMYDKRKKRVCVVDYSRRAGLDGSVVHSGDVMRENGGTHTIDINLDLMPSNVTMCVFVISAWASAKLSDIISPSVSFSDANAEDGASPLCVYELDKQDKIDHLTSVIMCKLYRTQDGGWHVQAVGDAHKGDASNYDPIFKAVETLL